MSPVRRSYQAIIDDPDEGHKMTSTFRGGSHQEIVEAARKAAEEFFGEDDRYWLFVEGFEAKRAGTGLPYSAVLTIKRIRKGAEKWDERLREVIAEHERDSTTGECHAHQEDRPCCIDYIAALDGTEYEDRPTRSD